MPFVLLSREVTSFPGRFPEKEVGREGYGESVVSCTRTQHHDLSQGSNPPDLSARLSKICRY